MKELLHRIGEARAMAAANAKTLDDHEDRLRKLEHLTAKVVGGAVVGSAVGGWILSQIGGCIG